MIYGYFPVSTEKQSLLAEKKVLVAVAWTKCSNSIQNLV